MKIFTIAPELSNGIHYPDIVKDPFFRIMLSLPPHLRQFACSAKYAEANQPTIDFLNQNNVRIKINQFERLGPMAIVYGGASRYIYPHSKDICQKMRENGTQFLYYCDFGEDIGANSEKPDKGDFVFYPSETHLFCWFSDAKFNWVNGAAEAGINPLGAQATAVGLMRGLPLNFDSFVKEESAASEPASPPPQNRKLPFAVFWKRNWV